MSPALPPADFAPDPAPPARAGQSRWESLGEAAVQTTIGFAIALAAQLVVFPAFGVAVGLAQNIGIGLAMTGVSVARTYVIRRLFERRAIHRAFTFLAAALRETAADDGEVRR